MPSPSPFSLSPVPLPVPAPAIPCVDTNSTYANHYQLGHYLCHHYTPTFALSLSHCLCQNYAAYLLEKQHIDIPSPSSAACYHPCFSLFSLLLLHLPFVLDHPWSGVRSLIVDVNVDVGRAYLLLLFFTEDGMQPGYALSMQSE